MDSSSGKTIKAIWHKEEYHVTHQNHTCCTRTAGISRWWRRDWRSLTRLGLPVSGGYCSQWTRSTLSLSWWCDLQWAQYRKMVRAPWILSNQIHPLAHWCTHRVLVQSYRSQGWGKLLGRWTRHQWQCHWSRRSLSLPQTRPTTNVSALNPLLYNIAMLDKYRFHNQMNGFFYGRTNPTMIVDGCQTLTFPQKICLDFNLFYL